MKGTIGSDDTSVFPRFLDLAYPNVERELSAHPAATGAER